MKYGYTFSCRLWLLLFCIQSQAGEAPELLLLGDYRPEMDVRGWYMSEKLDGVRAYWDGKRLLSRQGNSFAAPDWFTGALPPFELDGELWLGRGLFQQTVSVVTRARPGAGWRRISYNVFELPHAPGGLMQRLGRLQRYLIRHPVPWLRIVPQQRCRDRRQLQQRLRAVAAAGGEGLVLRNPDTPYETGRSANALKVKLFDDREGRVIGYRPGKGKYRGMVGALWVEIEGGVRFYIGSGLNDAERSAPPPLGSIVTFRYRGLTDKGIPRHATFLRIRNDEPATGR